MKNLKLYNTLTRQKEDFIPIDPQNIRIYACGPTVYNYAHIGNARVAVVNDLLVKVLRTKFPKVTYVSNITDIDDKIMKSAKEQGKPINEITEKYTKIYNSDMEFLGVKGPDIQPKATEFIPEMISLIQRLIDYGNAYTSDNHVIFDVSSYESYGALSGRKQEDLLAGSRVKIADFKNNPSDFVLWKPSSDDQPGWDSPWGVGRPGWHIECTAMTEKTLGFPFDIHSGGQDLIFPHHENEIAQGCAAQNCQNKPGNYAKYWFHNGFVTAGTDKMSKSLGNIQLVHDLIKSHQGEVLRLVLISSHYRQPLSWCDENINQAKANLDRLYGTIQQFGKFESQDNLEAQETDKIHIDDELLEALYDDLNTSKALARINSLASELKKASTDEEKSLITKKLLSSGKVLGILQDCPEKWFEFGKKDSSNLDETRINDLIAQRNQARKDKNFQRADEIRDELKGMGIEIIDKPTGTTWKVI